MTTLSSPAPWGWKSRGWVSGSHRGIDYGWYNADPAGSRRVVAAAGGRVVEVYSGGGYNQGWGNRVVIEHAPGVRTTYNHLSSIAVSVGQEVATGAAVGVMGQTGEVTGISLHFELYLSGNRVDPAPYFTRHLPGTAPAEPTNPRDRVAGASGANARRTPSRALEPVALVAPGRVVRMAGWVTGESVDGVSTWYRGADGAFYWAGGFTSTSVAGLEDLNPKPEPVAPEPVAPEPVAPEPVVPEPVVPEPVVPEPVVPEPRSRGGLVVAAIVATIGALLAALLGVFR